MITLYRESSFADALRAYKIEIDGSVVGEIKSGKSWSIDDLPHGTHTIRIKIDWTGSNTLEFQYDGDPITFECESSLKGYRLLFSTFYLFKPNSWCKIRQIS